MTEAELRALIRESVARHLTGNPPDDIQPLPASFAAHASHFRYALTPSDGPCLIEPGVSCNHCGYCESHGH